MNAADLARYGVSGIHHFYSLIYGNAGLYFHVGLFTFIHLFSKSGQ